MLIFKNCHCCILLFGGYWQVIRLEVFCTWSYMSVKPPWDLGVIIENCKNLCTFCYDWWTSCPVVSLTTSSFEVYKTVEFIWINCLSLFPVRCCLWSPVYEEQPVSLDCRKVAVLRVRWDEPGSRCLGRGCSWVFVWWKAWGKDASFSASHMMERILLHKVII